MATFKVWLKVKDSYGNTKEIDGGDISINFDSISETEVDQMAKKLDPYFTTDVEVEQVVENNDSIKYSELKLKPKD